MVWPRHISEITTQKLSLKSASHVYRFDDAAFELWLLDVDCGVVDFELKTRLRRLGIRQPIHNEWMGTMWCGCTYNPWIGDTLLYMVLIRQLLLPNVYVMLDIVFFLVCCLRAGLSVHIEVSGGMTHHFWQWSTRQFDVWPRSCVLFVGWPVRFDVKFR